MGDRYIVFIEVWPHHTGRGQDVDQIQAGPRTQSFEIRATDIRDALGRAELIAEGLHRNPIVFQAPIREVRKLDPGEHLPQYDGERDTVAASRLQMPTEASAHG